MNRNWEKAQFTVESYGSYRVTQKEIDALNEVFGERLEALGFDLEDIQDDALDCVEDIKNQIWEQCPIEQGGIC
jgi:hypothetical protein